MRTRTLRGQLNDNDIHQIVVDDGRLSHGYVIKEFYVWPRGTGGDGVFAILGTQYDMQAYADAGDNRQWIRTISKSQEGGRVWVEVVPGVSAHPNMFRGRVPPASDLQALRITSAPDSPLAKELNGRRQQPCGRRML